MKITNQQEANQFANELIDKLKSLDRKVRNTTAKIEKFEKKVTKTKKYLKK